MGNKQRNYNELHGEEQYSNNQFLNEPERAGTFRYFFERRNAVWRIQLLSMSKCTISSYDK